MVVVGEEGGRRWREGGGGRISGESGSLGGRRHRCCVCVLRLSESNRRVLNCGVLARFGREVKAEIVYIGFGE